MLKSFLKRLLNTSLVTLRMESYFRELSLIFRGWILYMKRLTWVALNRILYIPYTLVNKRMLLIGAYTLISAAGLPALITLIN